MSEGAEAETGGISLMSLTYEQLSQLKRSLEEVGLHVCDRWHRLGAAAQAAARHARHLAA
jgi:hypothetical protein